VGRVTAAARKPPEDTVEVFDEVEQGSPEWAAVRMGTITASRMKAVMANGRDGGESKMRATLMRLLAAEIIHGKPMATFSNNSMARGIEMEPWALEHYAFTRNVEVERVGFVRRTIRNPLGEDLVIGASPDGLVAKNRVLQVKTMQPDLIVEMLDTGRQPSEHKWQCHAEMWVTGRDECDLMIGYEGFPIAPTFSFKRDEALIVEMRRECEKFAWELRKLIERVRQRGGLK
jgi:hypothetical protein